jgi:hypothetical protein
MQRRRIKHIATLDQRLADQARRAREDVEKLAPGKERDALLDKIREIKAPVIFNEVLGKPAAK